MQTKTGASENMQQWLRDQAGATGVNPSEADLNTTKKSNQCV
jgi:hypothetical protein